MKKRYSDDFRAGAVLMLQAAGYPDTKGALTRVSENLGIHARTLSRWFNKESNPPPDNIVKKKTFDLISAIRGELINVFEEMSEARDQASYKDLTTAAGILIDKLQLLSGEPTARTETITRWLDELPQDEYEAVIAEAERIISTGRSGDTGGA